MTMSAISQRIHLITGQDVTHVAADQCRVMLFRFLGDLPAAEGNADIRSPVVLDALHTGDRSALLYLPELVRRATRFTHQTAPDVKPKHRFK